MDFDMVCTECGSVHLEVSEQRGEVTCINCGKILEHSMVRHEVDFAPGGGGPIGTFISKAGTDGYRSSTQYKTATERVNSAGQALSLNAQAIAQAKNYARQLLDNEHWAGISTVVANAIAYVTARQNDKPLTLSMAATMLSCDVFLLGRAVKEVQQLLNVATHNVSPKELIAKGITNLDALKDRERSDVDELKKVATGLMNLAMESSLHEGRKPGPLAGACIMIAAKVLRLDPYVDIESVAIELNCVAHTITDRITELRSLMLRLAHSLPWAKNVTPKNVYQHTKFIIDHSVRLIKAEVEKAQRERETFEREMKMLESFKEAQNPSSSSLSSHPDPAIASAAITSSSASSTTASQLSSPQLSAPGSRSKSLPGSRTLAGMPPPASPAASMQSAGLVSPGKRTPTKFSTLLSPSPSSPSQSAISPLFARTADDLVAEKMSKQLPLNHPPSFAKAMTKRIRQEKLIQLLKEETTDKEDILDLIRSKIDPDDQRRSRAGASVSSRHTSQSQSFGRYATPNPMLDGASVDGSATTGPELVSTMFGKFILPPAGDEKAAAEVVAVPTGPLIHSRYKKPIVSLEHLIKVRDEQERKKSIDRLVHKISRKDFEKLKPAIDAGADTDQLEQVWGLSQATAVPTYDGTTSSSQDSGLASPGLTQSSQQQQQQQQRTGSRPSLAMLSQMMPSGDKTPVFLSPSKIELMKNEKLTDSDLDDDEYNALVRSEREIQMMFNSEAEMRNRKRPKL